MAVLVFKRDGRKEQFDVDKIKQVIAWACIGLDINPLALESKFDDFVKDEISTQTIQDNLIYHSRIMCTPEEPEWTNVAGRLETMKRWKETQIFEKSFYYYVNEQLENGVYKHPGIKKWTKNEIIELGKMIQQERDLDHSYGSVLTAQEKYLMNDECIQQMFMVNAMIIASVEKKEDRLPVAKSVYEYLSQRKISLATPWLSNLRANRNIASCFILSVNDSLDSIFDNIKNAARISKNGGGLGVDFSHIRSEGATVMGNEGGSKGVTSWIKIFNDTAVSVDQGSKRAGAFTVHLPIWHNDIEDFLELQTENGDFRKKSFDVFPQVGIMDQFMKEVSKEDGGTWYTFCPYEVKQKLDIDLVGLFGKDFNNAYKKCVSAANKGKLSLYNVYNAKSLMKTIMRTQFETGLPYLTFLDRMNELNPNKHDGYIPAANLCVAPETEILTDKGYLQIADLEGQTVNVWNGEEWSSVEVIKTNNNAELFKVTVEVRGSGGDNLETLWATPYHKWYDYFGNECRTHELTVEKELLPWVDPDGNQVESTVVSVDSSEYRRDKTYCFSEPKRHMGVFNGILTGQCTESFSNVTADQQAHVCNLASIVVGRMESEEDIIETAKVCARILDNGIALTEHPINETKTHNDRYRTIGIGIQGLHDYVAKHRIPWSNHKEIGKVAELIEYGGALESIHLASQRGSYPAFEGSRWDTGEQIQQYRSHSYSDKTDWDFVERQLKEYGIRNSQLSNPAPNTSTSIFMDAAAGVMPVYSAFFNEDNNTGQFSVFGMYLKDNPLSYEQSSPRVDKNHIIKYIGSLQNFVTAGISADPVFDLNDEDFSAKELFDYIMNCWKAGHKTIYYIRSIKKGQTIDDITGGEEVCVACSG